MPSKTVERIETAWRFLLYLAVAALGLVVVGAVLVVILGKVFGIDSFGELTDRFTD